MGSVLIVSGYFAAVRKPPFSVSHASHLLFLLPICSCSSNNSITGKGHAVLICATFWLSLLWRLLLRCPKPITKTYSRTRHRKLARLYAHTIKSYDEETLSYKIFSVPWGLKAVHETALIIAC